MDTCFELIDLKSGNVIADFGSEAEAIEMLRRSYSTHGPAAIRDFSLMLITDEDQQVVAMREDLERLVRDSAGGNRVA